MTHAAWLLTVAGPGHGAAGADVRICSSIRIGGKRPSRYRNDVSTLRGVIYRHPPGANNPVLTRPEYCTETRQGTVLQSIQLAFQFCDHRPSPRSENPSGQGWSRVPLRRRNLRHSPAA